MKLLKFDFEIQYRLGMENKATDALSQLSTDFVILSTIFISQWVEGDIIDNEVHSDGHYKEII